MTGLMLRVVVPAAHRLARRELGKRSVAASETRETVETASVTPGALHRRTTGRSSSTCGIW